MQLDPWKWNLKQRRIHGIVIFLILSGALLLLYILGDAWIMSHLPATSLILGVALLALHNIFWVISAKIYGGYLRGFFVALAVLAGFILMPWLFRIAFK